MSIKTLKKLLIGQCQNSDENLLLKWHINIKLKYSKVMF